MNSDHKPKTRRHKNAHTAGAAESVFAFTRWRQLSVTAHRLLV